MNEMLTTLASGDAEGLIWLIVIVISIIYQVIGSARKTVAARPKSVAPPAKPKQAAAQPERDKEKEEHSFLRKAPAQTAKPTGAPEPTVADAQTTSDGAADLRRFLEALTGTLDDAPRPVEVKTTPFVPTTSPQPHAPIIAKSLHKTVNAASPSTDRLAAPLAPATAPRRAKRADAPSDVKPAKQVQEWLASRNSLRNLVLSYEILGPPKARQGPGALPGALR